jgi:hypothetical protein
MQAKCVALTEFCKRLIRITIASQPPALLDEQPFKQIGGSNEAATGDRQPQVRDACLEISKQASALGVGGFRTPAPDARRLDPDSGIGSSLHIGYASTSDWRCLAHRMRNLAVKVPTDLWPELDRAGNHPGDRGLLSPIGATRALKRRARSAVGGFRTPAPDARRLDPDSGIGSSLHIGYASTLLVVSDGPTFHPGFPAVHRTHAAP